MESGWVSPVIWIPAMGEMWASARESGFCGRIRHLGECSGYTKDHLPKIDDNAPLLNAEEARFASFAARMAFSSLWIR